MTKLQGLNLWGSFQDISPLASLTNLEHLRLGSSLVSDVTSLEVMVNLKSLSLYKTQIMDTSPLYRLLIANGDNNAMDIDPGVGNRYNSGSLSIYINNNEISQYPPWDVNEDGSVDDTDVALVTADLGNFSYVIVTPRADINKDKWVNNTDLKYVMDHLDSSAEAAPSINTGIPGLLLDPAVLRELDRDALQRQLEILRAENDGSLTYLRAIALLESVLAEMRPEKTVLLANYPNPFNPETWIPYHLANDSDVQISIYDINGALVRQLDLGDQQAGYYVDRIHSAYWMDETVAVRALQLACISTNYMRTTYPSCERW